MRGTLLLSFSVLFSANKLRSDCNYSLTRLNVITGSRENKYYRPQTHYKLKVVTFIYFVGVHVFKMLLLPLTPEVLPSLALPFTLYAPLQAGSGIAFLSHARVETGNLKTHYLMKIEAVRHENVNAIKKISMIALRIPLLLIFVQNL